MSVAQSWFEFADIDLRMAELALAHKVLGQTSARKKPSKAAWPIAGKTFPAPTA